MGVKRRADSGEGSVDLAPSQGALVKGPKVNWRKTPRRPFRRDFARSIYIKDAADGKRLRAALGIEVQEGSIGEDLIPPPLESFEELGVLPHYVLQAFRDEERLEPSPIQAQAIPVLVSGHNLLALVAGKASTADAITDRGIAHIVPAIVHARDQPAPSEDEPGPVVLLVAASQDASEQLAVTANTLLASSADAEAAHGHPDGLYAVNVSGGGARSEKAREARGAIIVAGTPKRIHDMATKGQLSLSRVTMLICDGLDKLLDGGFVQELQDLGRWVRPERQTALFASKSSKPLRDLATELCYASGDPVRVRIGRGAALAPALQPIVGSDEREAGVTDADAQADLQED
eukprot:TRINITY_DN29112_c0_g2_i1.p1 TRINITY_DN29112_c0_g2~~TRINITY_DN29112_c0_g2_i1.p1  ORF type:complete len:347 (+),score=44.05 TRINITY_DN29112_c0_g2_i1:69-1109(+)